MFNGRLLTDHQVLQNKPYWMEEGERDGAEAPGQGTSRTCPAAALGPRPRGATRGGFWKALWRAARTVLVPEKRGPVQLQPRTLQREPDAGWPVVAS